ncbi:retron St85 family RNA-directed DNA polymerase [Pseudoalteromonas sp. BSi20495]|uniref:retron St85 family RNA-directed DNA polymerase n=1 Tax=Pseudoalteromonas sp. BSi20495 TaxID=386429 RepID=UPI00023161A9|nr:retron St85 family RNA-directed DNA polymerase [Pseudoalteromonas sp. BSi20495]GAA81350.1 reverse transcriptase [Pseudoalteromonas sp. BSi20495]
MHICQALCAELKLDKTQVIDFALESPKMYKVYAIPKRTSGKRIIAHPAKRVKVAQHALLRQMKVIFPIHHCAFAYQEGLSIKLNAQEHCHNQYLLKMDFQNFFNSITAPLFVRMLDKLSIKISPQDTFLIEHLAFWCPSKETGGKRILSVGAPSSPFISNWIMYGFDKIVFELCRKENIVYTRYADDLTFSTNKKNVLYKIPKQIKSILREELDGGIVINDVKTIFTSKKHNRHVTGITLTNQGLLSIGRKRKRHISLLLHKFSLGLLGTEDILSLRGLLTFANHIESDFKARMTKKYSPQVIQQLLAYDRVHNHE